MLERVPQIIDVVDIFFRKLGGRAQDGLVEMLEKFLEERVRRHTDAYFGALDVEPAGDMRVGGQNERVRAGNARLHDVEREIVDACVVGSGADARHDERHEEFLHRLLERVELVDGLRGFGVAPDGVSRLGRVEHQGVVFESRGGELDDARLRIIWMNFESHARNIKKVFAFGPDFSIAVSLASPRKRS